MRFARVGARAGLVEDGSLPVLDDPEVELASLKAAVKELTLTEDVQKTSSWCISLLW